MLDFPFRDVLPSGHMLAWSTGLGTLLLLLVGQEHALPTLEQPFTPAQMSVVLPLLHTQSMHESMKLLHANESGGFL